MQMGFIEAHTNSEITFLLQSTNTHCKREVIKAYPFISFFHGLETFLWSDIDYKAGVTPLSLTVQLIKLHQL